MVKNRLHNVYNCISDCTDVYRLYGTDLYYYSTCMRNSLRKTESIDNSENMSNSNEVEDLLHSSHQALNKLVAPLIPAFLSKTGFTLSKVRDEVNEIMHPNTFLSMDIIPSCPWTCKHHWRKKIPKPIGRLHSSWLQLVK